MSAEPAADVLSDIFSIPVKPGRICAFVRPAISSNGLPIGLQLLGRPFGEETILRAAFDFEQATQWHTKKAAL